jgi:hypothetical protein
MKLGTVKKSPEQSLNTIFRKQPTVREWLWYLFFSLFNKVSSTEWVYIKYNIAENDELKKM